MPTWGIHLHSLVSLPSLPPTWLLLSRARLESSKSSLLEPQTGPCGLLLHRRSLLAHCSPISYSGDQIQSFILPGPRLTTEPQPQSCSALSCFVLTQGLPKASRLTLNLTLHLLPPQELRLYSCTASSASSPSAIGVSFMLFPRTGAPLPNPPSHSDSLVPTLHRSTPAPEAG